MQNKVRDVVRVTGNVQGLKKARKQPNKPGPVTKVTVNPLVWNAAMRIARGDRTRIEVINPVEVRVVNKSRKR